MEEENASAEKRIAELELQESEQSEDALARIEKENNNLVQMQSNLIAQHKDILYVWLFIYFIHFIRIKNSSFGK